MEEDAGRPGGDEGVKSILIPDVGGWLESTSSHRRRVNTITYETTLNGEWFRDYNVHDNINRVTSGHAGKNSCIFIVTLNFRTNGRYIHNREQNKPVDKGSSMGAPNHLTTGQDVVAHSLRRISELHT